MKTVSQMARRPLAAAIVAALAGGYSSGALAGLPPGAGGPTTDASVLSFQVQADTGINVLSFEYMFGTEEFPSFPDFNDIAAVFVNGVNVIGFSDGSPLVASNATFATQFTDNDSYGGGDGYGGGSGGGGSGGVSPFTVFNPAFDAPFDLADHLLKDKAAPADAGLTLVAGSASYQGGAGSSSAFTDLDLDPDGSEGPKDFSLTGDGILLTSGNGAPPSSNTDEGFSGQASGQGDAALDQLLFNAGLADPADFYGGPALDGDVPALAALAIGGGGGPSPELGTPGSTPLDIEYDGVSEVRTVRVLLDNLPVLDPSAPRTFDIKIAVSDEGDTIFDTGLFISNLQGETVPVGSDPGLPILPGPGDDPTDGFDFVINVGDNGVGLTPTNPIWVDPIVAVGYDFASATDLFQSVTLPDFGPGPGTVADPDGYTLTFDDGSGGTIVLNVASGETVIFNTLAGFTGAGVSAFSIGDIDPNLSLDPLDNTAFMVGLSFIQADGSQVAAGTQQSFTMTADTQNVVPEPGTIVLAGLGFLAFSRRLRRRFGS